MVGKDLFSPSPVLSTDSLSDSPVCARISHAKEESPPFPFLSSSSFFVFVLFRALSLPGVMIFYPVEPARHVSFLSRQVSNWSLRLSGASESLLKIPQAPWFRNGLHIEPCCSLIDMFLANGNQQRICVCFPGKKSFPSESWGLKEHQEKPGSME